MKKVISLLLVVFYSFSLCSCGKESKEAIMNKAETIKAEALRSDLNSNMVKAKQDHIGKTYICTCALNVEGNYAIGYEDALNYRFLKIYLSEDELAQIENGTIAEFVGTIGDVSSEEISIMGTTYTKDCFTMKNAYLITNDYEVDGDITDLYYYTPSFGEDKKTECML